MNTKTNKRLQLSLLRGGIAAFLASGIAIASVAFSAQGFGVVVAPAEAPAAVAVPVIAAPATRAHRCPECGVIESVQEINTSEEETAVMSSGRRAAGTRGEIEVKPLRTYEITIRMQDGSMQVVTDAKPANWRHGDGVIVIGGAD